jgi:hypothetical protein
MSEQQKPPSQRRTYRRREIVIDEPVLRQMSERERRVAERSLAQLAAAMLADKAFVEAEQSRQRDVTGGYPG